MSSLSTVASDAVPTQMRDSDWRALIRAIVKRSVIPMVGPDLMRLKMGDSDLTYDHLLAKELAARQDLTDADLALMGTALNEATLNDVVSACIRKKGDQYRYELHDEVWQIVDSLSIEPPRALTKLAEITDFRLFVTSTPDLLFETALQATDGPCINSRVYRRMDNQKEDTPERAAADNECRNLYYLFGKIEPGGMDFAICEEEMLRFFLKLQESKFRPKNLFDELRDNNLLLLGVNFRDWFARFFLWLAKDKQNLTVEAAGNLREYFADQRTGQDRPLVLFLQHFSRSTIIVANQPEEFVDELHRRWLEQSGHGHAPIDLDPVPPAVMPKHAVFLSYSRTDLAAVKTLFTALTRSGIPAWYDAALQAGDDFDYKLTYNIENCSAFLPVISSVALGRDQGYFRKEWKRAVDRDEAFYGTGTGSIIPIVIDQDAVIMRQPKAQKGLPGRFSDMQMYHCPLGNPTPELIASLKQYLGSPS